MKAPSAFAKTISLPQSIPRLYLELANGRIATQC